MTRIQGSQTQSPGTPPPSAGLGEAKQPMFFYSFVNDDIYPILGLELPTLATFPCHLVALLSHIFGI